MSYEMKSRYLNDIILFLFVLCLFTVLCACNDKINEEKSQPGEVIFYNWKDFTDTSILKDFKEETGVKVILKEYETRDMCIAQLQTNPELCDVLILDTYNFPFLKNQKLIKEFDNKKIPNDWKQSGKENRSTEFFARGH
jgi:spermidine/putrescine transport system substrate-binding protein